MFPASVEPYPEKREISEWFDWMFREIPYGGIQLPNEEIANTFASHALRLRDRLRDVYHHLPISLEPRLIESLIVYQCWELEKKQYATAKHPEAHRLGSMRTVEAERYVGQVGTAWGYHCVEGGDGHRYVITVPTGRDDETIPATEALCNRLARLIGLSVPDIAVVSVEGKLRMHSEDERQGRAHRRPKRAPELCVGFRCQNLCHSATSTQAEPSSSARSRRRNLVGILVLNTWTLNLSPRQWNDCSSAVGQLDCALAGDAGGLAGGDWSRFLDSTYDSLPAAQAVAARVKKWDQINPWVQKVFQANLDPIWEFAFRMPPEWYGGNRRTLTHVLEKLGRRQWEIGNALLHFLRVGYFPELRMSASGIVGASSKKAS